MARTKAVTPPQKMKTYRQRLRAAGMRPLQIWVPDVRSPRIAEELRRQSLLTNAGPDEKAATAFMEDNADHEGWV